MINSNFFKSQNMISIVKLNFHIRFETDEIYHKLIFFNYDTHNKVLAS